jgi:hypothetical protein
MFRFKKCTVFAAAILSAFIMTGCSLGMSVESLLSSPRLSEEQIELYDALKNSVNKNIILKYPKGGEYRSAFVIKNIDSEPTDEAIVFYEINGESEGEGNVRINILDQNNGKWVSVYDHAGTGTEIDRIMFEPLGNTDTVNIFIGFNTLSQNEKIISIYRYSDGILNQLFTSEYDAYYVMDIDNDSMNELALIYDDSKTMQRYAALIDNKNDDLYQADNVLLTPDSGKFTNICWGYIGNSTPALYIDSLTGMNQLVTEIIYCVNGKLRNPFYPQEIISHDKVTRPAGYYSVDIDSDGVVEIPTLTEFPGYNDKNEKLYITNWSIFENYSMVKKFSGYYNPDAGYCFMLPSRWDGIVTAKTDPATGEVVFCKYENSLDDSTTELMRISTVKNSGEYNYSANENDGYDRIRTTSDTIYLFKVPADSDEPLILTSSEIKNNFYVVSK